jgi:hypothetical protein
MSKAILNQANTTCLKLQHHITREESRLLKRALNLSEKAPSEALALFQQILQSLAKRVDHAMEKYPHLANKRCRHSSLTFAQQKQLIEETLKQIATASLTQPNSI